MSSPTGPAAPAFDSTNTYLAGISSTQDDDGHFSLPITIIASQIIGLVKSEPIFSRRGFPYGQVKVLVPGLSLGFINADYTTLLAQWQIVVAAYVTPPSSIPANTTGLSKALDTLQKEEPHVALLSNSPLQRRNTVSSPFVEILQSDLDTFATEFAAVGAALQTYIEQLVANQAVPMSPASEAGLAAVLAKLQALEVPGAPPVSF